MVADSRAPDGEKAVAVLPRPYVSTTSFASVAGVERASAREREQGERSTDAGVVGACTRVGSAAAVCEGRREVIDERANTPTDMCLACEHQGCSFLFVDVSVTRHSTAAASVVG